MIKWFKYEEPEIFQKFKSALLQLFNKNIIFYAKFWKHWKVSIRNIFFWNDCERFQIFLRDGKLCLQCLRFHGKGDAMRICLLFPSSTANYCQKRGTLKPQRIQNLLFWKSVPSSSSDHPGLKWCRWTTLTTPTYFRNTVGVSAVSFRRQHFSTIASREKRRWLLRHFQKPRAFGYFFREKTFQAICLPRLPEIYR